MCNSLNFSTPKVSVVMPTYNRSKELPRSIRSVLSQTLSDFELIIVDDCSVDDTEEVINSFNDNRIRYEKLDLNVGGAEARNIGVRLARADIIAFQDSDDEWTCFKLESTVYDLLKSGEEYGAVFTKGIQLWEEGCRLMPTGIYDYKEEDCYQSLLWQNYVDTPTLVIHKKYFDKVGGFTTGLPRYQDWDLALKLAKITKLKFIKEPRIISYVTEGSITSNKKAHLIALNHIYKSHVQEINTERLLKAAWLHRLGDAKAEFGISQGRTLLLKAALMSPLDVRYSIKFLFSLLGRNMYIYCKSKFRSK